MAIVRNTKVVDKSNRVSLPREWAKPGEEVYFDITKAGHLIIRKMSSRTKSTYHKEVDNG
mgnify:CR=1 FL=1